jgi:hypothetical protein
MQTTKMLIGFTTTLFIIVLVKPLFIVAISLIEADYFRDFVSMTDPYFLC